MKKTISINISGVVFNIEEDAYAQLKNYLDSISRLFVNSEGHEEIMADIEARVAELFQERLHQAKNVVDEKDVQEVIGIMGKPEDYLDEGEYPDEESSQRSTSKKPKRFYRDSEHAILGGVCSGISHFLGWDPLWIRLVWGLSIAIAGVGVLPYIVLWILIPEARTTAEKLEMVGEPVTVETIKKKVDETLGAINSSASGVDTKFHVNHAKSQFERFFDLVFRIIKRIASVGGRFLGAIFIIAGLLIFGGAVYSYFEGSWLTVDGVSIGTGFSDFSSVREALFTSDLMAATFLLAVTLLTLVPILALLTLGFKLMFKIKSPGRYFGGALFFSFIIGIILLIISGITLAKEFAVERSHVETHALATSGNTLFLNVSSDGYFSNNSHLYDDWHLDEVLQIRGDSIFCGYPQLRIVQADAGVEPSLTIESIGRGYRGIAAQSRAESIAFKFKAVGDSLSLDPFFKFAKSQRFRAQELDMVLSIPLGFELVMDQSVQRVLDRAERDNHLRLRDLPGHKWTMTKRGLSDRQSGPLRQETDNRPKKTSGRKQEHKARKARVTSLPILQPFVRLGY